MPIQNRCRVEFPLTEDSPSFLEAMFMEAKGDGNILIGMKKTNGTDYADSLVSKDELRRALAVLTAGEGLD